MSKFEQRDGDFNLFPNDKKGNEKAPDYRGTAKLNGKTMNVSAWIKQGSKGQFIAGRIEERVAPPFKEAKSAVAPEFDDSLPPF